MEPVKRDTWEDDYPTTGMARLRPLGRVGFYGLLFLAVIVLYAVTQFRGLTDPAAMEIAEISRNLARGEGWVTRSVQPRDYGYLAARDALPAAPGAALPVIRTAPGYPALQACVFRLIRPTYRPRRLGGVVPDAESHGVVPLGIVLTLTGVLAVWLLGRLLFNGRVALLGSVAYGVSEPVLTASVAGVPLALLLPLLTFSVLFLLLAVRRAATRQGLAGAAGVAGFTVLGAVCAAFAVLTDYAMLVPAVALLVWLGAELQRQRWLHVPLFMLVLAAVLVPWLLRNHAAGIGILGAAPYAALYDSSLFPADSLARTQDPAFNVYRVSMAVRQGMAGRLMETLTGRGFARAGVMFCFFVLALFHSYERSECRSLRLVALTSLVLLPIVSVAPGGFSANWLVLMPFIMLFGMSAFLDFLEREEYFEVGIKPLLVTVLLVLCLLPAGLRMLRGPAATYPPYYAPIQRYVGDLIREHEVVLTDIPQATAWYGDCTAVLLPLVPDAVAALPGGWERVGGVYLTTPASDAGNPDWPLMLLSREVPDAVPLRYGLSLPAGRQDQLLLSDRPRWAPEASE